MGIPETEGRPWDKVWEEFELIFKYDSRLILMITSIYIYTRRCLEKDALILTQLIYNIKDYYYAEKQIATDNNSLLRFNDKWELVTECFQ